MKHGVTNSKDAADAEEIFALKQTNVDEAIASIDPNHDQIAKALDIKVKASPSSAWLLKA
jgi:hypothetical protein